MGARDDGAAAVRGVTPRAGELRVAGTRARALRRCSSSAARRPCSRGSTCRTWRRSRRSRAGQPIGGTSLPSGSRCPRSWSRRCARRGPWRVTLFAAGLRAREAGAAGAVLGWAVLSQDALAYVNTLHLLYVGLLVLALGGGSSALALLPQRESRPTLRASPRSGARRLRVRVERPLEAQRVVVERGSAGAVPRRGLVRGALADICSRHRRAAPRRRGWSSPRSSRSVPSSSGAGHAARRNAGCARLHGALEWAVHPDFFGFAMAILLLSFVDEAHASLAAPAHAAVRAGHTMSACPHISSCVEEPGKT